jgi:hypothetical protein
LKFDEYKSLKKSLENNENISRLTELLDQGKKIDDNIISLQAEIKNCDDQLKSLKDSLQLQLNIFEKSNDLIKKDSLYDASFILGKSAMDLCEKFEKRIKRYKLKEVSKT